jgi:tetratricopeptide (TPR) repeat protein
MTYTPTLGYVTRAIAAALALVLSGGTAHAAPYPECERTPSSSDVDAAKGLHKAAEQYYAKGRYDKAIQSWLEAYGFDCRAHGLLINIGNAYEKLGETKKAVEAFETYLARTGDDADATIVDKVKNLKELLALQEQKEPEVKPDPLPSPKPPPPPPANGGDKGTPDAGPGPYPWVLVGIGGAVAIAGGVLLGVGLKNESDANDACPPCENDDCTEPPPPNRGNCPTDIAEKGNEALRLQPAGGVMLGVGGAAIIGGILWYELGSSAAESQDEANLRVVPNVGPGFSGLTLTGRF